MKRFKTGPSAMLRAVKPMRVPLSSNTLKIVTLFEMEDSITPATCTLALREFDCKEEVMRSAHAMS